MNRFLLEIKYMYERLDPLLPAMPFMDASSALFVLMIFHTTWFLTKKRISLLEKSRWLTSMRLTDLSVCPSLWRLPGREGNGQGRQLEPYLAGGFPSPCRSTCGFSYSRSHRSGNQGLKMKTVPLIMKLDATYGLPGGPVATSPCPRLRGPGLIPGQRTRSHMPQMKTTKIQGSQINK